MLVVRKLMTWPNNECLLPSTYRCDGSGRIAGGIGAVPGFQWWPIKAYRPCGKSPVSFWWCWLFAKNSASMSMLTSSCVDQSLTLFECAKQTYRRKSNVGRNCIPKKGSDCWRGFVWAGKGKLTTWFVVALELDDTLKNDMHVIKSSYYQINNYLINKFERLYNTMHIRPPTSKVLKLGGRSRVEISYTAST